MRREVGEMTPERLLIELLLENRRLGILDEAERQAASRRWMSERRFDLGLMVKMMERQKVKFEALVGRAVKPTFSDK